MNNNLLKLKVRGVGQDNSGMDISGLKKLNHLTLTLRVSRNKESRFAVVDFSIPCIIPSSTPLGWGFISFVSGGSSSVDLS